jgi:hypothetical protein
VDDGLVELTVDGSGFCGPPGAVKVFVNDRPVEVKAQNPFRVVTTLSSSVETGPVKVVNLYGEYGESPVRFEIIKPPKGAEANVMLTYLVIGIVALAVLSIVIVALRSRKAKVPLGPAPSMSPSAVPSSPSSASPSAPMPADSTPGPAPSSAVAKTMAMSVISKAVVKIDDREIELRDGPNTIGRDPNCPIILEVSGVSREHARIELDSARGMIWIEDLGSTNGTFVGPAETKVDDLPRLDHKKLLKPGEAIWIGGKQLQVSFDKSSTGGGSQGS